MIFSKKSKIISMALLICMVSITIQAAQKNKKTIKKKIQIPMLRVQSF